MMVWSSRALALTRIVKEPSFTTTRSQRMRMRSSCLIVFHVKSIPEAEQQHAEARNRRIFGAEATQSSSGFSVA